MVGSRAASEWMKLENRHYQCETLYRSLGWGLTSSDLSGSLTACAPCGGPLAVISDSGWGLSGALTIYSADSEVLSRYEYLREVRGSPSRAIALGWSLGDRITVVYEDGFLVVVSLAASAVESARVSEPIASTPRSGGEEDQHPERLRDAVVCPDGRVIVRTTEGMLFSVFECEAPVPFGGAPVPPPKNVAVGRGNSAVGTMVVIASTNSSRMRDVDVLVVGEGGLLTRVTQSTSVPIAKGQVHRQLALSPDGKLLAAALVGGRIVVRNVTSLAEVVHVVIPAHFLPGAASDVEDGCSFIAWVGPDAVAVTYGGIVLLVGPGGEVIKANIASPDPTGLVLQTEIDGLRVVSASMCEFIQMVPDVVEAVVCRDTTPANQLYLVSDSSCYDGDEIAYAGIATDVAPSLSGGGDVAHHISPLERYRILSKLREDRSLLEASRTCVEAAYLVREPAMQKSLLRAAVYGQRFEFVLGGREAETSNPRSAEAWMGSASARILTRSKVLVSATDRGNASTSDVGTPMAIATLRLLNSVRSKAGGVPLTKPQLDTLGYAGLVRRVSGYGRHALALRIATFCGIPPHDALASWARSEMLSSDSDEIVARNIVSHFEAVRSASERSGAMSYLPQYTASAKDALESGRSKTAELLLRKEPIPALKVPLYLEMRLDSLALFAGVASKDNEVVMDVIEHLMSKKSTREIASVFRKLPSAMSHRATDLLVEHLREMGEHEQLRTLLSELGRHRESAMDVVAEVSAMETSRSRLSALEKAVSSLGRWGARRSNALELQLLQHTIAAAQNASDLEKRRGLEQGQLYKASSSELLSIAARISDPGRRRDSLTRLRRDLKIPDRRFFWVVLESLADAGDLSAVEALSNSAGHGRPPPIGLMAFVDVCLKYKQEGEAMKYAMRIADLRDRARALARCGRGKEAADIAARLRNQQLMEEVEALVARHSMTAAGSPVRSRR